MTRGPCPLIVVIADDVSGAAEIAGIARRQGWSATLQLTPDPAAAGPVEVLVIDAHSRDLAPPAAAALHRLLGAALARQSPPPRIFKKIDSVLRGWVVAEADALARSLGRDRVLLLPANPSRGRAIRTGHYEIDGQPLHTTAFARDPLQPAASSRVADLLARSTGTGVILDVPDVTSAADLERAMASCSPNALVAGAADAFTLFCLRHPKTISAPTPTPTAPSLPANSRTLIINGSAAPVRPDDTVWRAHGAVVLQHSAPSTAQLRHAFTHARCVRLDLGAHSGWLDRTLPTMVDELPGLHLALTGGATARAALDALGLTRFTVSGEWAPGVVALLPEDAACAAITLKPGSYPWPETFIPAVTAPAP